MPLNTKIPQQIVSSTTTALSVKRGDAAMLVADLDKGAIVLMDGKTYGGIPMAREDVQIRAGSDAITVNNKEWAPLLGNINIDINPSGFVENVVSPSDKVLGVGVDGKIAAQLSVAYDETTGLFSLKGKDGETISSFTLVIPTGITPKSVALVENPESQEPGLYLEFVFIDDDDVEIKLYANMDALKDVYTAGRGITISDDRVISVDEDAISGVIADDLIEENSGLKVVNDKLHLDDHASETPEYGLGDEDHYGHVRLADSGDSRATVQAGIAATPAAVKDVDDRAVHNEGDETISGVKTFVDTPKVNLPGGGTDDVATLTDVQMLVDGTVWNKRVDSIPEDTDAITADMPVGALVVTPDDGTGSPIVALQAELDALKAKVKKLGLYNTEEWITESGTWTVPLTGWYLVNCIGGGQGGMAWAAASPNVGVAVVGGASGEQRDGFLYLHSGDEIVATIGAGGLAADSNLEWNKTRGGDTMFGSLLARGGYSLTTQTSTVYKSSDYTAQFSAGDYNILVNGNGLGARNPEQGGPHYYGTGGGAMYNATTSPAQFTKYDGYPGAIYLCYYDPNKQETE